MRHIKVWCEYDFNGSFGGNNNEDIFTVSKDMNLEEIEGAVLKTLMLYTGLCEWDLEGMFDWEFIEVSELK